MSSVRRADPFGVAALAAAGTLAGHELGYLSESGGDVSHAYFGVLGPIVMLALCVAAWVGAVRILRRDGGRTPSLAVVGGVQVGLFVAMELGERITTGSVDSLISAPVLFGLAAQPVVAFAALRLLRAGRRLVEALFVGTADRLAPARLPSIARPVDVLVGAMLPLRLRVRGPPMV